MFDFMREKMYNKNTYPMAIFSRFASERKLNKIATTIKNLGFLMKYKVHRIEVNEASAEEKLERYLNRLEGEVLSVFPFTTPKFQGMGATSKVKFLLIVEKTE